MATFGVSMVRDEADVIAGTLRHMADEVDHLLVADNLSTDGTRDILADLARELPLTVVDDPVAGYYQSAKMSALAAQAAAAGAAWIVPFDADELWYSPLGRIREVLAELGYPIAVARLTNHLRTAIDLDEPDPFVSMVWRQRDPAPLPKVAFRWEEGAVIAQGNHAVDFPSASAILRSVFPGLSAGATALANGMPCLQVRHFPYRSADQFTRKAINGAAAYRAAPGLSEQDGAHWRAYGEIADREGPARLGDVFRTHFWYLSPTDAGLVRDPAPYLRWRSDAAEGPQEG